MMVFGFVLIRRRFYAEIWLRRADVEANKAKRVNSNSDLRKNIYFMMIDR